MSDLRVTLVQCDLRWEDPEANCRMLEETLGDLGQADTDLIVLPEMFATGFTMNSREMAEPMAESRSVAWLKEQAHRRGCVVTGSVAVVENGDYFNRLVWARPDGSLATYDKRHLFRMAGEHERYAGGTARLIVDLKGWRICPQVCYDLRFPVWLRNRWSQEAQRFDYDLLVFVANWPAPRRHAWSTLLRARAIENLGYCIGVNRVGTDGNDLPYAGDSIALDFLGQPLVELGAQEQVVTVTLDPAALAAHRERFPAWMDADAFTLSDA